MNQQILYVLHDSHIICKGLKTIVQETFPQWRIEILANAADLPSDNMKSGSNQIILTSVQWLNRLLSLGWTASQVIIVGCDEVEYSQYTILPLSGGKEDISQLLTPILGVNNSISSEDDSLSEREQDVLRQVALGLTNKEIANRLFISTHTVITHRKNITRKLAIKTVAGLTVYAIMNNLVEMDELNG